MAFGWNGRNSGGSDQINQGMITEVRAYWEALRDGDALPRRDRVDPRGIAGALENSFLVERIAPGIARFRIAGMLYNDLMGMDIRGMPISCLFLSEARDRLQQELERVFHMPAIVTLDLLAERTLGRGAMRGRMQILPMLGREADSTLAIGCLEISGTPGRAPHRFTITNTGQEPLQTPRTTAQPAPATDMPRPPRAQAGVPHLRLVKA